MNNDKPFDPNDMYHMFIPNVLENNIWYFKNVVSYPKELVQFINEVDSDSQSHSKITEWGQWTASNDTSVVYGKNKNVLTQQIKENNSGSRLDQKILYISNSIKMAFEMCLNTYLTSKKIEPENYILPMGEIPLREWAAGSGMGPHCDNYDGHTTLAFSMIVYLNDEYEGGEIEFPNQGISLKPEEGSLIIFPSNEPYLHKVNEVLSGKRYTSHLSVYKGKMV
jgi:hypothetical protein